MTDNTTSLSYRDAGVDIDAGNELIKRIGPVVKKTFRPGVLTGLGGFGGLFELPVDKYREPVLVSGTDGVGTKLKVAMMLDRHDTIGIDLVAMCVNDIVVQQGCRVNKLDRGGQMHVIRAFIATHPRGSQSQHGAQTFAACLDQMRCDFGDARGVFRGHTRANQRVDRRQIIRHGRSQLFVWFGRGEIKAH